VLTLLGVVAFVVALLLSVMLHEAGHFLTARRYGMKATKFFVGFGPTLFSRQRGETEYGVKAIPAGGYVKIVGMTPLEEVEPGDEDRVFYKHPWRQRTVVLAAGSTVHFVLAVLITLLAVLAIGAISETSPRLASVAQCVADDPAPGAAAAAPTGCAAAGSRPAPAIAAGVRRGDVVVSADGRPVRSGDDLTAALRGNANRPVTLTVRRDGASRQLTVVPAPVLRLSADGKDRAPAGTIGVSVQRRIVTQHVGPVEGLRQSGDLLWLNVKGIGTVVTDKLGSITRLYSKDRDPAGFVGVVGVGRISGEVVNSDETVGVKIFTFLSVIAGLNLFVGVFNLLPLLPLDGGHIAVVWFESVRDRIRRARGYAGPLQRVDYNKLLPLTYAVALAFAFLTLFIAGADIVNPIRLT